ncbi:MAG: aldehyde dehydrogenase family protein [Myxococcota bacterium]
MRHIPILRHGVVYRSLDTRTLSAPGSEAPLAEVSLANAGLVRRDARRAPAASQDPIAVGEALSRAAELLQSPLRLDPDAAPMDVSEFRRLVQASTGLSEAVITHQLSLLAETLTDLGQRAKDIPPAAVRDLAVVLPSNALAVNRAWLPAIALGARVALKPGASDPFTPHRLVAALIAAGISRERFCIYPSDHDTTGALIGAASRTQLFGDASVVARYGDDPHVQVNGPGRSAVVLGSAVDWRAHIDDLVEGVALHNGRSCLNTSSIVTLGDFATARDLATALCERLDGTPSVTLSDPDKTHAIAARVEEALAIAGATDLSDGRRDHSRCTTNEDGQPALAPSVILCQDPSHPLARIELPLPFVSVTAVAPTALSAWLGHTLSVATLGVEADLEQALGDASEIERLCPDSPHSLSTSMASLHLDRMRGLLS